MDELDKVIKNLYAISKDKQLIKIAARNPTVSTVWMNCHLHMDYFCPKIST